MKHILEINKELIIIIPKQSKDKMNKERVMAVYNFGATIVIATFFGATIVIATSCSWSSYGKQRLTLISRSIDFLLISNWFQLKLWFEGTNHTSVFQILLILFLLILRKTTSCANFDANWFFIDFKLIPTQVMSWSSTNHSVNQTCFVEDIFKFWVFFLAKTPVTRFAI